MGQEIMEFGDGSRISWTICKQSAPRFRQIIITTPHQSAFTGWMLLLTPSQQFQSTEGILQVTADNNQHKKATGAAGFDTVTDLSIDPPGAKSDI